MDQFNGGGSGTISAGPCENAERGTYLSNVCWLFEDLREVDLIEADEDACTVVAQNRYQDWFGLDGEPGAWVTKRIEVRFNRADLTESTVKRHLLLRNMRCAELRGEGVGVLDGEVRDHASFCGEKSRDRVQAAVENLYSRYCTGQRSEF